MLIERARPPYGFAPPAGHVDDSPSFDAAAERELKEEVGLDVSTLRLVAEGRKENPCRRPGGKWHYWKIYEAIDPSGEVRRSYDETKKTSWLTASQMQLMADRSRLFRQGEISEEDWNRSPGLEPVWEDWLTELSIVRPKSHWR